MNTLPLIFSRADIAQYYPNRKSLDSYLYRKEKNGEVSRIRRGLYAVNHPTTGYAMADRYQIGCRAGDFSYLSYHAAIEYYGLSNQSFASEITVCSLTRFAPFVFMGVNYRCKVNTSTFGILDHMKETGVRVVDQERMLLDCLSAISYAGGIEEVKGMINGLSYLDENKLARYLPKYETESLYLKCGYALTHWSHLELSREFYRLCQKHKTKRIFYFGTAKGRGEYCKEYSLVVPKQEEIAFEVQ